MPYEIRDEQTRMFYQQLPYELTLKDPLPEDIQAVRRFAKETGDIKSLSDVDIEVIALGVRLAKENGKDKLIKKEPKPI